MTFWVKDFSLPDTGKGTDKINLFAACMTC
jgi:hypothetical protein